jgi:hypothetical protein
MDKSSPVRAIPPVLTPVRADLVAEVKGKEMALKACKNISVDADKEASFVLSASKMIAAGQLFR